MTPGFFDLAEYHVYAALARAARCDAAPAAERIEHETALAAHHHQLEQWAELCPANFTDRVALVGAEIARIEGRVLDAEQLYEEAIRSAREHGFVHNEALAYELAARFYAARGFEPFADLYVRHARRCYQRWGADGKVRQLEDLYPNLKDDERAPTPSGTIGAPVDQLDLATVIKVSQAVSGEIVSEKLIDTLMRTAIEYAGAERGVLLSLRAAEWRIEAEATTRSDTVIVHLQDRAVAPTALPQSVLHYVERTHAAGCNGGCYFVEAKTESRGELHATRRSIRAWVAPVMIRCLRTSTASSPDVVVRSHSLLVSPEGLA